MCARLAGACGSYGAFGILERVPLGIQPVFPARRPGGAAVPLAVRRHRAQHRLAPAFAPLPRGYGADGLPGDDPEVPAESPGAGKLEVHPEWIDRRLRPRFGWLGARRRVCRRPGVDADASGLGDVTVFSVQSTLVGHGTHIWMWREWSDLWGRVQGRHPGARPGALPNGFRGNAPRAEHPLRSGAGGQR